MKYVSHDGRSRSGSSSAALARCAYKFASDEDGLMSCTDARDMSARWPRSAGEEDQDNEVAAGDAVVGRDGDTGVNRPLPIPPALLLLLPLLGP